MSISPFRVAKLAGARRVVTELLNERRCPFPDEVARVVIDELLNLGWAYPGFHDDEHLPQPSISTPEGRAKARRIYAETRAALTDMERSVTTDNSHDAPSAPSQPADGPNTHHRDFPPGNHGEQP